ncbi:hypothetical protein Tco_1104095 [Tanacetum coccineum]
MVDVVRHLMSRELGLCIGYMDDLVGAINEIAPTTLKGVNQRVTDLSTVVEQETTIMYGIMEDAQDDRSQLRGRVNLLYRDRPVHRHVMSLRTTVSGTECIDFRVTVSRSQETEGDFRVVEHRTTRDSYDMQPVKNDALLSVYGKMAPKRKTTRLNPSATPTSVTDTHTTTSVTNAQIQAMINEGVTAALASSDAQKWRSSHTSGTGARRPVHVLARECYLRTS